MKKIIILAFILFSFTSANSVFAETYLSQRLSFGVWLPYWHETDGTAHLMSESEDWDEVSPFSFEVNDDFTIKETMKFGEDPWKTFISDSHQKGKKVIPTIAWLRGSIIHLMLSDSKLMSSHLSQIEALVTSHPEIDGIDIDYEGKWVEDKDLFSQFLKSLKNILSNKNKILSCTVEPRTTDEPTFQSENRVTKMAWANDYAVINEVCDQVRIMAYDQLYFKYGDTKWTSKYKITYQLLSSTKWVRDVLTYTKKYINPSKIYLGIPTYGYQVSVRKYAGNYEYKMKGSYTYARALQKWPKMHISRFTNDPKGDGFYYINTLKGWNNYFVISDAYSINEKIKIAKEFGIRGTYLFSAFGKEDPAVWNRKY